jgi:cytochrome P450/NADPH-cytochrome P450 reductase
MRFVNRNTHEAAAAPKAGAPAAGAKAAAQGIASSTRVSENAHPLLFAYGSNTGTCQEVAQQYAQSAQRNGFKIDGVIGLDDLIPHLTNTSKHVCVIIVTATFNGTPPDNAKTFNQFLDTHTESLSHVKFAVFGVGNSQWAQTFQAFPNKIDAKFTELKASRIAPKGTVDVNDPSTLEDAYVIE